MFQRHLHPSLRGVKQYSPEQLKLWARVLFLQHSVPDTQFQTLADRTLSASEAWDDSHSRTVPQVRKLTLGCSGCPPEFISRSVTIAGASRIIDYAIDTGGAGAGQAVGLGLNPNYLDKDMSQTTRPVTGADIGAFED